MQNRKYEKLVKRKNKFEKIYKKTFHFLRRVWKVKVSQQQLFVCQRKIKTTTIFANYAHNER